MPIENVISAAIVRQFSEKLLSNLIVDVAIVGGGPSALVAAKHMADVKWWCRSRLFISSRSSESVISR